MPKASLVIPLFNKVGFTERCLESIAANTPDDLYEVVIVDNGSTDGTGALLDALEGDVTIIRNPENRGFAKACNQGAEAATGDHIVFVNNDTEASPGWLEPLLAVLDDEPDVAAVGAKLLFPDGTLQHAGIFVLEGARTGQVTPTHAWYRGPADLPAANWRSDVQVVTGAVMAVRRQPFWAAGGFDEGYWNGYEDVDLCYRFGADGWRVVYEPASCLVHHESVSGPERFSKVNANVERLSRRWDHVIIPDLLELSNGTARPHPRRTRLAVVLTVTPEQLPTTAAAIAALEEQLFDRDRIAVAWPGPTGAAAGLASTRVRVVVDDELLAARRRAVELCDGDLVLFLAGDVVLPQGSVDQLVAAWFKSRAHDPAAASVVGPVTAWAAPAQGLPMHAPLTVDATSDAHAVAAALTEAHRGRIVPSGELDGACLLAARRDAAALVDLPHAGTIRRSPDQRFAVARSAFAAKATAPTNVLA